MCYKGGPYCTKPALKAYEKAKSEYNSDPSVKTGHELSKAKLNYFTSPGGIEALRKAGRPKEADKFEKQRENAIARAKEEELAKKLADPQADSNFLHRTVTSGHHDAKIAAAHNPNLSMRTLQHIVDNETVDDFRFAVARHPKSTPEMIQWASDHPSLHAKQLAMENPNISRETINKIRHDTRAEYLKESEANKNDPSRSTDAQRHAAAVWKKSRALLEGPSMNEHGKFRAMVDSVVPRQGEFAQYYADTDAKHFSNKDTPGSKFTDPRVKNLNDAVAMTVQQRGSLQGDDRAKLIKFGADPDTLSPDHRYLIVQTQGKLGSQDINSFPVNTKFRIERTKSGANCSVVADVEKQASVNFGVVIMGKVKGHENDCAITAHPGLPARMNSKQDRFADYEGKTLSMNHVMEIAGSDKVNINTRVAK